MKHEARAWSRTMRTVTLMSRPRKALNASAQAPSSRTVTTPASGWKRVTTISRGE